MTTKVRARPSKAEARVKTANVKRRQRLQVEAPPIDPVSTEPELPALTVEDLMYQELALDVSKPEAPKHVTTRRSGNRGRLAALSSLMVGGIAAAVLLPGTFTERLSNQAVSVDKAPTIVAAAAIPSSRVVSEKPKAAAASDIKPVVAKPAAAKAPAVTKPAPAIAPKAVQATAAKPAEVTPVALAPAPMVKSPETSAAALNPAPKASDKPVTRVETSVIAIAPAIVAAPAKFVEPEKSAPETSAVPVPTPAARPARIMIHYAGSKKDALELKAALSRAGFERIHMRKTNSMVRRSELRYFDAADQATAERLGGVDNRLATAPIRIVPIEATPGLVEIWHKGLDTDRPAVKRAASPAKQKRVPQNILASFQEEELVLIGPASKAAAVEAENYVRTPKMPKAR